jgi:Gpi18-like mannosyltransferase
MMGAPEGVFLLIAKMPMIVSDILGGFFIYKLVLKLRNGNEVLARQAFALYVLNPLLILVTAIWGSFDSVAALFTILSLYYLLCKGSALKAGVCLGIAIGIKLYPVLILPVILIQVKGKKENAKFLISSLATPGIASLPFFVMNPGLFIMGLTNTYGNTGTFSIWSEFVTPLLEAFVGPAASLIVLIASTFLLLVGVCVLFMLMNKLRTDPATGCLIVLSYVLLMAQMVHENYFVWALPFLVLVSGRKYLNAIWILPMANAMMFNQISSYAINSPSGIFYWLFITERWNINLLTILPGASLIRQLMILTTCIFCMLLIAHYIRARKFETPAIINTLRGKSTVTAPERPLREKNTWRITTVALVATLSICSLVVPAVALNGNHYAAIFSTSDIMPGGVYYGGASYFSAGINYTDQTMTNNSMGGEFWNISFPHPAEELRITTAFSSTDSGIHIIASLLPDYFSVAFRVWNSTDYAYIKIILIGSAETNMNDSIKTFVVYPWQATGETLTWNFSSYDFIESGMENDLLSPAAGQFEQQLSVVVIVCNAQGQSISALTQLQIMLELGRTLEIF